MPAPPPGGVRLTAAPLRETEAARSRTAQGHTGPERPDQGSSQKGKLRPAKLKDAFKVTEPSRGTRACLCTTLTRGLRFASVRSARPGRSVLASFLSVGLKISIIKGEFKGRGAQACRLQSPGQSPLGMCCVGRGKAGSAGQSPGPQASLPHRLHRRKEGEASSKSHPRVLAALSPSALNHSGGWSPVRLVSFKMGRCPEPQGVPGPSTPSHQSP